MQSQDDYGCAFKEMASLTLTPLRLTLLQVHAAGSPAAWLGVMIMNILNLAN